MKTEDIIKKLRQAQTHTAEQTPSEKKEGKPSTSQKAEPGMDKTLLLVGSVILGLIFVTGLWVLWAKGRASNLTRALDPEQVKGLRMEQSFNPNRETMVLNIQEGQDRNAAVDNLGSTLPIISQYNYKSFTDKMFTVVGAAPWALTENFAANSADPGLINYLLSKQEVAKAFKARPDVAPLLEDPQLLAAFVQDLPAMEEFFNSDTVQKVLSNEQMVKTVANSLFMSHLLVSPSLQYFRKNPKEALRLIMGNPYLEDVRQNPYVRAAVKENRYLKDIAPVLLEKSASAPVQPAKAVSTKNTKKGKARK